LPFIRDEDQELFLKLRIPAYEVQVGCHELLGHGSGRVFVESADGKLNFSPDLIHPVTKEKVTGYYKQGETYDQIFGAISSSFEECRAECVGIYLSANNDMLKIFGHEDKKAQDAITFVNWLSMARAGVTALEFYNPEHKKWGQAHMQARWGILQVMLSAGDSLLKLHITDDDVLIELKADQIKTLGVPKVAEFLQKLQVYRATADIKAAEKLYAEITGVPSSFLKLRGIVLSKKKPRRMFVQNRTRIEKDDVVLEEFPVSCEGIAQFFAAQFPPSSA
jgi:dipeptidyl-peptidase-3